jgi:transposase
MSYKTIQVEGKQVRLHRHLMEKKLGRKLTFNEVVHHINGNKLDNRINNLKIVSRGSHILMHPEIRKRWEEKNKLSIDIEQIKKMYSKMSIREVASHFGVSAMAIWHRLKDNGIQTTKLTQKNVQDIRLMITNGISQKEISVIFGVSQQLICDIKQKRRYAKY